MTPWPHQTFAFEEVTRLIDSGERRILVTSPTGGGKSLMQRDLLYWAIERDWPVAYYTNRRMLFDQLAAGLDKAGVQYGRRAAGHPPEFHQPIQLCMVQTEISRVLKKEKQFAHHAKLLIVDEAHQFSGDQAGELIARHTDRGATVVGFTATPVGLAAQYDQLVVAGCNSELRKCGALVQAVTYAPESPDLSKIKSPPPGDDFSPTELRKTFARPAVFARVYDWAQKLNPDFDRIILFGPDVSGSVFFAECFYAKGVPAAHIDGEDVWVNGELHKSDRETRDWVIKQFKDGDIKVLCNRFVLREGIDIPEIRHVIFATAFGSLSSYLQAGGRALRKAEGKDGVYVQDHGNNFLRHGSLNDDRLWTLETTNRLLALDRADTFREHNENKFSDEYTESHLGNETEPIVCPQCARPRRAFIGQDNKTCPSCGYRMSKKARYVIQQNGQLKLVEGDFYKARWRKAEPCDKKDWEQMYFRAKRSGTMTFAQAEGLYAKEHYWRFPERNLPLMPAERADWHRKVCDVPIKDLQGYEEWAAKQDAKKQGMFTL